MIKIAIMQPYFFPYIGYWQLMEEVDFFVLLDDVNYINRGFINRNFFIVNNKKTRFTLELKKASQNRIIKDISIGSNSDKILKMISLAYKKSPYFYNFFPLVSKCLKNTDNSNLGDLLYNSINTTRKYLAINTKLLRSSEMLLDRKLKGQYKIIEICKTLKGSKYINNFSGAALYDSVVFNENQIELSFIKSKISQYKQFNNTFIPNLSIIDIAMFNDLKKIRDMLLNFEISKI